MRSSLEQEGARIDRQEDETGKAKWVYATLGLGAALFFYLHLFRFPLIPIYHDGDAPVFLEHAERMLQGEVLYRDIFQFNLPGIELLYQLGFRCLGTGPWVPNLMLLFAATAITLLIYSLARLVLRGSAALLPAVAFLVVCQRSSLDGSHHWYSTLLVLLAINIVARTQKPGWISVAGALLGLASLFTSSRGVFVALGVALFFLWRLRCSRDAFRAAAALLAPLLVILAGTLVYLGTRVGARVLFESLVVFPLRYYGAGEANNVAVFFDEWKAFFPLRPHSFLLMALWCVVNLATPALLIAFAVRTMRKRQTNLRDSKRMQTLVLFACAGFFALLAVCGAPSAPRLNCAAVFAYLLGAVLAVEIGGRRFANGVLLLVCLAGAAEMTAAMVRPVYALRAVSLHIATSRERAGRLFLEEKATRPHGFCKQQNRNRCSGPKGTVLLLRPDEYEYFAWLGQNARPGDGYFGSPAVNWILGLKNPARIEWVEADAYTRPEQVRELIAVLDRRHTRFLDPIENGQGGEDSLGPLRAYVKAHYHVAHQFSDGGVILENDTTGPPGR